MTERIAELRRLTLESDDLDAIVQHFYEELVRLDEFLDCAEVAVHPLLEEILRRALPRAGSEFDVASFMVNHMPEHGLWHGAATSTRGGIAAFYYFDELDIGVAQVVTALDGKDRYNVRFRCVHRERAEPLGSIREGHA